MTIDRLTHDLTLRDLSDPAHGPHAMQPLLDQVASALRTAWGVPADVIRTGPVVSIADNYDRLGYDAAAVTRDSRYSRYVLSRHHAPQPHHRRDPRLLDALDNDGFDHDRVLALPGLVYRRDSIDRSHVGEPHQVDLWRIRSAADLGEDDLVRMISVPLRGAARRPLANGARGTRTPPMAGDRRRGGGTPAGAAERGLVPPELLVAPVSTPSAGRAWRSEWGWTARSARRQSTTSDCCGDRATHCRPAARSRAVAPGVPPPADPSRPVDRGRGRRRRRVTRRRRTNLARSTGRCAGVRRVVAVTGWAALPPTARHRLGLQPDQGECAGPADPAAGHCDDDRCHGHFPARRGLSGDPRRSRAGAADPAR